jgi:hypothetical protein
MTGEGKESTFVTEKELGQLVAQMKFEDFLAKASQVMEIYEMFDEAAAVGPEYSRGYQDGFWAARKLDVKYHLAKAESMIKKSSSYIDQ